MKKWSAKHDGMIFGIIMLVSICVRWFYFSSVSIYELQHDGGLPYTDQGHLGYITYLMSNGQLPDFDVRKAFQFWHPPLHHGICAVFLTILWKLFPGQNGNLEPVQLLAFLYITVCIWVIWKLLQLWDIKGKPLAAIMLFVAFHPTFITLSGSVNMDPLCLMFMFLALYVAFLWYRTPKISLIIVCALFMGLGMSTKALAAVAAFPIGFLLLMGLIRDRKKVTGQLVLFAVIVFPLGLWWYLRNYLLFGVPLNYVNYASTDSIGYIGAVSAWERLLDFNIEQFKFADFYIRFEGENMAVNPLICLLKTASFGRWYLGDGIYLKFASYIVFLIWICFNILSIAALPVFIKESKRSVTENIAILILAGVQLFSYFYFCIDYPFVWSMDVRYAMSLLVCQFLFVSVLMKRYKAVLYITGCLAIVFAGSAVLYVYCVSRFCA